MTSWRHTRFASLLGVDVPIVQGPFGSGLSSARLAAAVSNGGGLGSYGAHILSGEQIRSLVREMKTLTPRPFAINLWVPLPGERAATLSESEFSRQLDRLRPYREELGLDEPHAPARYAAQDFEEQLEVLIETAPPVASFVFGPPPVAAMDRLKSRGVKVVGTATTVEEALALEAAGCDAIVASGSDAGGHRPSFLSPASESLVGTFALVPQVVDAVGVPVIAAGGIADGRGIAAALTLGAAAAQLGTAFLACDESNASDAHKAELVKPSARRTILTRAFTGRLARGIRTPFAESLEQAEPEPPPYPIRAWFVAPITKAAVAQKRGDRQSLWAGQAATLARRRTASECLRALTAETDRAFRRD